MSTDDASGTTANDLGGAEDMLSPMESTDSDDMRNADGDEVVDPPEGWTGADKYGMSSEEERQGETLDQRLAEEEPDVTAESVDPRDGADAPVDSDVAIAGSDTPPEDPGEHHGQVGGTPEDGESFYQVVE
ncbi:hypothetical protein [Mycobacterium sp. SMC-4]|uniref:hypothetical protein n=1 Tax=Mycobacterium sp. SMC-4 TaxID=2857059 RepID=UPI003D057281